MGRAADNAPDLAPGTGVNPLVDAATPLLALIAAFRETHALADPMGLRTRVEQQMRALGTNTQGTGATPETLAAASYCLCTAIDESVLRTPWGEGSDWRKLTLLRALHGDAWGGEKFFEILKKRMADPAPNIDLLELLYLCLTLGFEGQYAMFDDGRQRLEQVRADVYELIRKQRGAVERDLSPHWQSEDAARVALEHPLPVWVVGAVAAALLLSAFIGFSVFLAETSAPVMNQLAHFGDKPPMTAAAAPMAAPNPGLIESPEPQAPPPPDALAEQLQTFLKPEIEQQLVSVLESATHITVRINGNGLFAPGSDSLLPQYLPTILRIRAELAAHQEEIDGDIIVVGHTDNRPLKRSLRFQDNYDLSRARAETVARLLKEEPGITSTIERDGKGDSEPVGGGNPQAGNRTPEQQAANRRVEILIER